MELGYRKIKMNRFEVEKIFNVSAITRLHLNSDVYENEDSMKLIVSRKRTGEIRNEKIIYTIL